MFLLIFIKISWHFMWIVCKLHEMSRHFIWKNKWKSKKKKKKNATSRFWTRNPSNTKRAFYPLHHRWRNESGQKYNSNRLDFSMRKPIIIIFPYFCVPFCYMYITFPFKCSVLSFTDSIRKKKNEKKTPATHEWSRFYFHWNLEFWTLEFSFERKNIENSNVE